MTGEARSCARRCLAATVSGELCQERLLVQVLEMQVPVMLPPQVLLLRCYSVMCSGRGSPMKRSSIFLWILSQ